MAEQSHLVHDGQRQSKATVLERKEPGTIHNIQGQYVMRHTDTPAACLSSLLGRPQANQVDTITLYHQMRQGFSTSVISIPLRHHHAVPIKVSQIIQVELVSSHINIASG